MARILFYALLALGAVTAAEAAGTRATVVRFAPAPSVADTGSAAEIESYIHAVLRRVVENQTYPREALERAWEGSVRIDLTIGRDGQVKLARLAGSSGFAVLDAEALDKVRGLIGLPLPPTVLRGREFTFAVPVLFRLDDLGAADAPEMFNP